MFVVRVLACSPFVCDLVIIRELVACRTLYLCSGSYVHFLNMGGWLRVHFSSSPCLLPLCGMESLNCDIVIVTCN